MYPYGPALWPDALVTLAVLFVVTDPVTAEVGFGVLEDSLRHTFLSRHSNYPVTRIRYHGPLTPVWPYLEPGDPAQAWWLHTYPYMQWQLKCCWAL